MHAQSDYKLQSVILSIFSLSPFFFRRKRKLKELLIHATLWSCHAWYYTHTQRIWTRLVILYNFCCCRRQHCWNSFDNKMENFLSIFCCIFRRKFVFWCVATWMVTISKISLEKISLKKPEKTLEYFKLRFWIEKYWR